VLPPNVVRLARLHQIRQQQLATAATGATRKLWRLVDGANVIASWTALATRTLTAVSAAQAEAARGAGDYVDVALALQDAASDVAGTVPPQAFAGVASDGRPLESLLTWPAYQVQGFLDGGMPLAQALDVGQRHLARIVATQIQDAARVSTGVAIVNNRRAAGYIRVVSAAACSRCIILAGRWYASNAGFDRHPNCSCSAAPAAEHTQPQSPRALFDAMSPEQLRRAGWSDADVRAIADGGDIYQVTNAHRDLRSVSVAGRTVKTTLHGSTRRGAKGRRNTSIRLTPEQIYLDADEFGWSRDETIRQLKRFGYII
jgi:hypothetical protein